MTTTKTTTKTTATKTAATRTAAKGAVARREPATVPATAKKPADHRPPAPKPGAGYTVSVRGVQVSVDPQALSDWELIDALAQIDAGAGGPDAVLVLPGALRRLAGDAHKALLDAVRDPATGRVSIDAGAELIGELFAAVRDQAGLPNS